MWDAVESRKHTLHKIFPFGTDSTEVMLYGNVSLALKNGSNADMEWAGRAKLHKDEASGQYKMSYYQVYLVCSWSLFILELSFPTNANTEC